MGEMQRIWDAFEPPDGVRAELLAGEIVMQASPTLLHNRIVRNLVRQVDNHFEAWGEQGILLEDDSAPRPDVIIVEGRDLPVDNTRYLPVPLVRAVVEVVSRGKRAWKDDLVTKREAYAEAKIPLYLIVDPRDGTWTLLGEPADSDYRALAVGRFGDPVRLGLRDPAGVELVLDTTAWIPYPPD